MDSKLIIDQVTKHFDQSLVRFSEELKRLRTGRASVSMLDGVLVEAYGTKMPLNQLATIATPEPQLLQVTPFDPTNLQAIATAIRNDQSLGLNPVDDGHVVRLTIPPLNEERRRELAKQIGVKQEESLVAMRNARHGAFDQIALQRKDNQIGEDDARRIEKQVDEVMAKFKVEIENQAKAKEVEIMKM